MWGCSFLFSLGWMEWGGGKVQSSSLFYLYSTFIYNSNTDQSAGQKYKITYNLLLPNTSRTVLKKKKRKGGEYYLLLMIIAYVYVYTVVWKSVCFLIVFCIFFTLICFRSSNKFLLLDKGNLSKHKMHFLNDEFIDEFRKVIQAYCSCVKK